MMWTSNKRPPKKMKIEIELPDKVTKAFMGDEALENYFIQLMEEIEYKVFVGLYLDK